jgi:hypothetical protein
MKKQPQKKPSIKNTPYVYIENVPSCAKRGNIGLSILHWKSKIKIKILKFYTGTDVMSKGYPAARTKLQASRLIGGFGALTGEIMSDRIWRKRQL